MEGTKSDDSEVWFSQAFLRIAAEKQRLRDERIMTRLTVPNKLPVSLSESTWNTEKVKTKIQEKMFQRTRKEGQSRAFQMFSGNNRHSMGHGLSADHFIRAVYERLSIVMSSD